MTNHMQGPFARALPFLWIGVALHLAALLLTLGAMETLRLLPIAIIDLILLGCLARGWRWAGYLTFFASAISGIVLLATLWTPNALPGWWKLASLSAHWLAAAAAFTVLWYAPLPRHDRLGD